LIKDHWDRLGPTTKKWLLENPGCQVLPRTVATMVCKETGENPASGRHGEVPISPEDSQFIRSKANEVRG
jgi:hypothetical protein